MRDLRLELVKIASTTPYASRYLAKAYKLASMGIVASAKEDRKKKTKKKLKELQETEDQKLTGRLREIHEEYWGRASTNLSKLPDPPSKGDPDYDKKMAEIERLRGEIVYKEPNRVTGDLRSLGMNDLKAKQREAQGIATSQGLDPKEAADAELEAFITSGQGIANILKVVSKATPEEKDFWKNWYHGAHDTVKAMATKFGVSLQVAAAVCASLSPNLKWKENVDAARIFFENAKVFEATLQPVINELSEAHLADLFLGMVKTLPEDLEDEASHLAQALDKLEAAAASRGMGALEEAWLKSQQAQAQGSFDDFMAKVSLLAQTEEKKIAAYGSNVKKSLMALLSHRRKLQGHQEDINDYLGKSMVNGPKVSVFYKSLVDPEGFKKDVVLDGHAINVWRGDKFPLKNLETPAEGGRERNAMIEDYATAASKGGMQPQEIQALTWYIWKMYETTGIEGSYLSLLKQSLEAMLSKSVFVEELMGSVEASAVTYDSLCDKLLSVAGDDSTKIDMWFDIIRAFHPNLGPAMDAADAAIKETREYVDFYYNTIEAMGKFRTPMNAIKKRENKITDLMEEAESILDAMPRPEDYEDQKQYKKDLQKWNRTKAKVQKMKEEDLAAFADFKRQVETMTEAQIDAVMKAPVSAPPTFSDALTQWGEVDAEITRLVAELEALAKETQQLGKTASRSVVARRQVIASRMLTAFARLTGLLLGVQDAITNSEYRMKVACYALSNASLV